jgi:NADPH:quinone reductase-like Zn-dependent oxidoreductase
MKAVRIHTYGSQEVVRHEEVSVPVPAADEVLVRVHAASVNPVDWKTRSGGGQADKIGERFPIVLGWDVSGTVEELGSGVVDPDDDGWAVGDEVFGLLRFPQPGQTYAEYVAAPAHELAPKPSRLSHVEAAAMPLAVLTAWQALFETGALEAGHTALVHAAAGGVGHLAVQLARWKGAGVVGTASGDNADFLRSLGAAPVDYTRERFEDVVSEVDLALVAVNGDVTDRSLGVVRRGGVLVSIRSEPSQEEAERLGVRAERVLVRPHGGQLAEISSLVDAGHVRPEVAAEFPLEEVDQAFELSESGHVRGKVVLRVTTG